MTVALISSNKESFVKTLKDALVALSGWEVVLEEDGGNISPDIVISDGTKNIDIYKSNSPICIISSKSQYFEQHDLFIQTPLRIGVAIDKLLSFVKNIAKEKKYLHIGSSKLHVRSMIWEIEDAGGTKEKVLTEKERDILLALYNAKDQSLTKNALLERVWGYVQGVETHTLETHIYRLRQKIEKDPDKPSIVVTTSDGYKIEL